VWGRWGVADEVLCAGNEQTMVFLENVLDEIADLFPCEYIHIGGDECPKVCWEKCPKCQAKIKELGLKDTEEFKAEHYLQSYVMTRMTNFLESGDTLSSIATRNGVSVAQLKEWNNLTSNNIKAGQKLKINGKSQSQPKTVSGEYTTYTIQSGDSFYSIAKNYPGVSAQDIMDFNGLSSSKIKPGMVIKIPEI
jgi:LysM repeat protein